ncbi:unnamed protein product [Darwinula stevensoni]|uniref:Peptidase S1 domain-containing protein n=1 Tax=Darwinula stevensoni TaxID=69355 RepID=A0A7R8XDN6_9CRUS|nr:unnamed protein product [Darwinula stevensoni]CAG0894961.1 unnamed protein product [Darwinula stevensoni]
METRGIAWVFFLGLLFAKVLTASPYSGEERRGMEDVVRVRDPHARHPESRIFYDTCICGASQYTGKRSGDPPGNSTDSDLDRIIGGTVVPSQTKYPWMAWGGLTPTQMGCTGALINDRYVLTAAHCVFANRHATFYVTLGDLDRSTSSESRSIQITARAIPHPEYRTESGSTTDNDIALMRLDTPVDWNAYPHIRPICLPSGPLSVAGQTVITAGPTRTYYVTLGDLDRSTSFESRSIQITARAIPHRDYRSQGNDNDIALMRLDTPVNWNAYPHIRPICLPSGPLPVAGQTVITAGWGSTNIVDSYFSVPSWKLFEATLKVVSDEVCRRSFSNRNYNNFICAYSAGSTIARGDSGGPLMYRTQLGYFQNVGINSFGGGFPILGAGFTEIGNYVNSFILPKTEDANYCMTPWFSV